VGWIVFAPNGFCITRTTTITRYETHFQDALLICARLRLMRRLPYDSLHLKTDSEQRHPLQLPVGTPPRHDMQVCGNDQSAARRSSLCMLLSPSPTRRILTCERPLSAMYEHIFTPSVVFGDGKNNARSRKIARFTPMTRWAG
jgi:hypothetical protein